MDTAIQKICVYLRSSTAIDNGTAMENLPINYLTEKIIGCAHKVSNTIGSGFLEKV